MKKAVQIQHDERLEYSLKCAKNAGFEYISMGFGSSKCFHNSDWEKEIIRVDKLLKENSLECIQTHLPYYDLRISAEILDEDMDTAMLRCIEAGRMLGADWNVYHARTAVNDNYSPRKSMEYAKIAVSPLAEMANKCKSGLAIENLPIWPTWAQGRFFTADYEDLCELNDYFKSEFLSVCWDFGHANLLGNNQKKAISCVGSRIKCTHIHNNYGNDDQHALPSQGNINWEEVIKALKNTGYSGALTLEINYEDKSFLESYFRHALDCLKYIENIN